MYYLSNSQIYPTRHCFSTHFTDEQTKAESKCIASEHLRSDRIQENLRLTSQSPRLYLYSTSIGLGDEEDGRNSF